MKTDLGTRHGDKAMDASAGLQWVRQPSLILSNPRSSANGY
jgi:hypothetical protein